MAWRVVLADDSYIVREGLAALMGESEELDLVAAVADLPSLLETVEELVPDVVVTDIRMPPTNTTEGVAAARHIRARHPAIGVLVLSQHLETQYVTELVHGGASGVGYLLKERVGDLQELVRAVGTVASGGSVFDPLVVDRLVTGGRSAGGDVVDDLTPREREVLALMAEGRTNAAISAALFLSERAVERHISAIFQKLGLSEERETHRRVTAVLLYLDVRRG